MATSLKYPQTVEFIESLCGKGKTLAVLVKIAVNLGMAANHNVKSPLVIVGSKTKNLLLGSYSTFLKILKLDADLMKKLDQHGLLNPNTIQMLQKANQLFLDGKVKVHSVFKLDNEKLPVALKIGYRLESDLPTIIFCTHKGLKGIEHDLLHKTAIFLDEIPDDLAKAFSYPFTAEDNGIDILEKWIEKTPHPTEKNKFIAKLKPRYKAQAQDIVSGGEGSRYKAQFITVMDFLLQDYAVLYHYKTSAKGGTHVFQAYPYKDLQHLVERAGRVTVMAANVQNTAFAFLVKHVLKYELKKSAMSFESGKHDHKAIIIPLLTCDKKISGSLLDGLAVDKLDGFKGNKYQTVRDVFLELVRKELQDDFILALNKGYEFDTTSLNVTITSTQVHGLNTFSDFTKAAYVASTELSSSEIALYKSVAKDMNKHHKELEDYIRAERGYEACYQFCLRTFVRMMKDTINQNKTAIFIVPDMHYAKYLQSTFEDGCAIIDDSKGFKYSKTKQKTGLKNTVKKSAKTKESNSLKKVKEVKNLISSGVSQNKACKQIGISKPTYTKYAHLV